MTSAPLWQHCIAHYDAEVPAFLDDFLLGKPRTCLLIAGAGFDPRSTTITTLLAEKLKALKDSEFRALFLREIRPNPRADLVKKGDEHATSLPTLVPNAQVVEIEVLSQDDGAVVGGHRAIEYLQRLHGDLFRGVSDIILDMSALSIGISFPVANFIYSYCRENEQTVNFHVMVASHPQLDAAISTVPSDVVDPVRGFSGSIDFSESELEPKVWLPHLALGRNSALQQIKEKLQGPVDVCPVLPVSQRFPRAADNLMAEFETELYEDWEVDPRNVVYAVEDDPLDLYRLITAIHQRRERAFADITTSHLVLSPSGNKVLAIGALMAALEHELAVRYVETISYAVNWDDVEKIDCSNAKLVHVWLHGEPYITSEPAIEAAGEPSQ